MPSSPTNVSREPKPAQSSSTTGRGVRQPTQDTGLQVRSRPRRHCAVEAAPLNQAHARTVLTLSLVMAACGLSVTAQTPKDPAWSMFVQEVRDVSMKAYRAAQAKDQDKMIEISETLSTACAGCHRKWRDRKAPDNRCK